MGRLAPAALLLLAAGLPAGAAEDKLAPPDLARYLRWGPVRVRPGIVLSNIGYDDNILLGSEERQVGDYTATVSPRIDGLLLFGHTGFLTFREQLDYTLYFDHTDQNYYDNRTAARFTLPLGRLGLLFDGTFNRVRERPIDLEDIRPVRREQGGGPSLIFRPGWRTDVEIGASRIEYRYSDPDYPGVGETIGERLDRDETAVKLRAGYRALGRTRFLLDGLTKSIVFGSPLLVDGVAVPRDTRERRLLGGVEFGEGRTVRGTLLVGWDTIDADDPQLADLSEAVGEARLSYRLNSRTRFEIDGKRLPGFTVFGNATYYLNTDLGLRSVYFFSRRIGFEAGLRAGRLTFPDSTSTVPREDDLLLYDVGVRLRLMENSIERRVEYSLRVGRYHRDSNLDAFDRDQATVGIGAVVGF